jgi:hypothetical protein
VHVWVELGLKRRHLVGWERLAKKHRSSSELVMAGSEL